MAPRASWKGFLNLSLVSVPVKAYSAANTSSQISLNQLHVNCNSRLRQKLVCPLCGDIERSEIVKGYEYAKDQFVVIDLDELEKLRAQDEGKAIKIDTFIDPEQINPIHYSESSYFLVPDGPAGQKPFQLLHRSMISKKLHCVARVVLHNKEQLVLVRPMDDLLCMTTLRYANEVKTTSSFKDELVVAAVSDLEMQLASTLIDETRTGTFDLVSYKDQYTERLTQLIDLKIHGQQIVEAPAAESPSVINLMDALKASVAKAQEARGGSPMEVGGTRKGASTAAAPATKGKKAAAKATETLAETLANPAPRKKSTRKSKTG